MILKKKKKLYLCPLTKLEKVFKEKKKLNEYRITNYECFEPKKRKTYYKVRRLNVTIYQ